LSRNTSKQLFSIIIPLLKQVEKVFLTASVLAFKANSSLGFTLQITEQMSAVSQPFYDVVAVSF
jgi:hypothetical protein